MTAVANRPNFYPDRFKDAARYYTDGRPHYPKLLSKHIAQLLELDKRHAVLDIGTGPGYLAIDFAHYAGSVTGLDPAAEMLAAAHANVAKAGVPVYLLQATSYDIGEHLGPIRLATFGRSFHWTDRPATLQALDSIVEPGGAVALLGDSFPDVPANAWRAPHQAVRESFGNRDNAATAGRRNPSHEVVLLNSAFSHIERVSVWEQRRTPLSHFLNRALSFSNIWQAGVEIDQDEVFARFEAALLPFVGKDGAITEVVEGHAIIARRPDEVV